MEALASKPVELASLRGVADIIQRGHSIISSEPWAELASKAEKGFVSQQKQSFITALETAVAGFTAEYEMEIVQAFTAAWASAKPFLLPEDAPFLAYWVSDMNSSFAHLADMASSDSISSLLAFLTTYLEVAEVRVES